MQRSSCSDNKTSTSSTASPNSYSLLYSGKIARTLPLHEGGTPLPQGGATQNDCADHSLPGHHFSAQPKNKKFNWNAWGSEGTCADYHRLRVKASGRVLTWATCYEQLQDQLHQENQQVGFLLKTEGESCNNTEVEGQYRPFQYFWRSDANKEEGVCLINDCAYCLVKNEGIYDQWCPWWPWWPWCPWCPWCPELKPWLFHPLLLQPWLLFQLLWCPWWC